MLWLRPLVMGMEMAGGGEAGIPAGGRTDLERVAFRNYRLWLPSSKRNTIQVLHPLTRCMIAWVWGI